MGTPASTLGKLSGRPVSLSEEARLTVQTEYDQADNRTRQGLAASREPRRQKHTELSLQAAQCIHWRPGQQGPNRKASYPNYSSVT